MRKRVPKVVVPDNFCAQGSLENKSKTKLQVSVPPRRSKRLREKAGCIHDGISVRRLSIAQGKKQNLNQVGVSQVRKRVPKIVLPDNLCAHGSLENKSKTKLQVSVPPRRSKRLREKAGCVLNKDSLSKPKKKKKKNGNNKVQGKEKVSNILTFSQRAMRGHNRFWIVGIVKDINSLFRAFAHQLYGKEDLHAFIRNRCCRYLELYRERFQVKVDAFSNNGGFQQYLDGMRNGQLRGGNLEITAISELYDRPVQIYAQHRLPDTTFSDSVCNDKGISPLRIAVDNGNYYNSVVTDAHKDTVFVCDVGVFEDASLFRHAMRVERNFTIQKVPDDGNCLFSAFSHQVYGDSCFHGLLREKCCNYMKLNSANFVNYVDTDTRYLDFNHYLLNMRAPGTWGGNLEITALSQLYQRTVEIYDQLTTPRNIFSEYVNYDNSQAPIRITYENGRTHYNSVVSENHVATLLPRDNAGAFEDAVLASLGFTV